MSRRNLIKSAGVGFSALALSDPLWRFVAPTYAQASGGTGNLLVLCQLDGGLDALSFLAPYTNSVYHTKRPQLGLSASEVVPLANNNVYGINNLLPFFQQLYAQNQCAIIQQVGYPGSNQSHFESQEIFEFGVRNLASSASASLPWFERLRKRYFDQPYGVLDTQRVGDPRSYGYPDTTYRRAAQEAFGRLAELKRNHENNSDMQNHVIDAYSRIDVASTDIRDRTADFTSTGTARGEFFRAAALASADLGTQILKVRYGGFDTHGSQRVAEQTLFPRINNEFQQFVADLQTLGMWQRTAILFYTEFGRRNAENGSPGTDHGYGGHMILCGPGVRGGELYGQRVTTSDLQQGSLPAYVDFRAVFSSCIRDWLGFDPRPIFQLNGETYDEDPGGVLFT
ncbi:MAG: DUF1501 domain-containing protein [Phycisphaerae bacterium]